MSAHFWSIHVAHAREKQEHPFPAIATGIVTLCWLLSAGVYIAAKWVAVELPPWTLAFWRPFLAALILLPVVWRHRHDMLALGRVRFPEVLLVGGIGLCLSQGFIYTGLQYTTAVNAGLIMALMPILTMILAQFLLGESMGVWQWIGSLIALLGMVVIVARGDLGALVSLGLNVGELWVVASAACFAVYSVLLKRAKFALEPLPLLQLLLCAASLVALPLYVVELATGSRAHLDTAGVLALIYVAAPGGALMYYLFNWSVGALGASTAGIFLYLQTVFVAVLAWLLLGERLYLYHAEGGALIAVGVLLVTALKPHAAPQPAGLAQQSGR